WYRSNISRHHCLRHIQDCLIGIRPVGLLVLDKVTDMHTSPKLKFSIRSANLHASASIRRNRAGEKSQFSRPHLSGRSLNQSVQVTRFHRDRKDPECGFRCRAAGRDRYRRPDPDRWVAWGAFLRTSLVENKPCSVVLPATSRLDEPRDRSPAAVRDVP